ncbi:hypothetical protein AAHA92_26098 [Salvia divinorum]|uniref:Prolamin-like domain-containing protein n=1 Tax=Salvia divinorum TaxID=28513 RepID=A0ABD1GG10_SALDI
MTPQSKTIILIPGFYISSVLTEGYDPYSPDCVKILPPDCLNSFYHEMCEDALASVEIPALCCSYFTNTLNYDCYFNFLVKQVADMHLCDDNLGAGRAQTIWDNCNGIYI